MKAIITHSNIVQMGKSAVERKIFWRIRREMKRFAQRGIDPCAETLAGRLGVTVKDVIDMQTRLSSPNVSIDDRSDQEEGQGMSISERMAGPDPNPEELVSEKYDLDRVHRIMDLFAQTLSGNDATVWQECIASDETRQGAVVAEQIGISRQ